jgi:hypothetical protein
MSAMNYLVDSITEFYKNQPFDINQVEIIPCKTEPVIKLSNEVKYICSKCGKRNNLGNHRRWHEDNCGIKQYHSKETKQKISKTLIGRELSKNCRKAVIESNKKRIGKKYPNGYKTKSKTLNVS